MAVSIEHVDKTVPWTSYVVMFFVVLLRIADEKIAIDVLDAERRKPGRYLRIGEVAFDFLIRGGSETRRAIGRKNIDRAGVEVGRKEKDTVDVDAKHESLINRTASRIVDGNDRLSGVWNRSGPSGNCPVLGGENKAGRYVRPGDEKSRGRTRGRVPDEAGRGRGRRGRRIGLAGSWLASRARYGIVWQRDLHLTRLLRPGTVVKGRATRGIVSDPEGTGARGKRHAPCIPQDRVDGWVHAFDWDVGDEITPHITICLPIFVVGANDRGAGDADRGD